MERFGKRMQKADTVNTDSNDLFAPAVIFSLFVPRA